MAELLNSKSCGTCNKASVCMYKSKVEKEIEIFSEKINKLELPLIADVKCNEWFGRNTDTIKVMKV